MNSNILNLIQFINNNYDHIVQLETLINLLDTGSKEYIVAVTTRNSHYNYKLCTEPMYQDPENHVDNIIKKIDIEKHFSII